MSHKLQIFCYTFAGGNAAFFNDIEKDIPEAEFVKNEYSGHGTRHREDYYNSFDELADDMYDLLKRNYKGGEYALFGYSMGSITLVEVLKRIINDHNMPDPGRVFLAAHEPQTKYELIGFTPGELDEWVRQRTLKFGGVPEKLLNNRAFWRMYLPIYRNDYSLIGKYKFEDLELSTDIPAAIFYSETDTPFFDMEKWKQYFTGDCSFHCYEGTHFFIQEHHREMAGIIRDKMGRR